MGGRSYVHAALDPVAGMIVAGIILRISAGIGHRALMELVDRQLQGPLREDLRSATRDALRDFEATDSTWQGRGLVLKELNGRRAGPEVHLVVELGISSRAVGALPWSEVSARDLAELESALLGRLRERGQRSVHDVRVVTR